MNGNANGPGNFHDKMYKSLRDHKKNVSKITKIATRANIVLGINCNLSSSLITIDSKIFFLLSHSRKKEELDVHEGNFDYRFHQI